MRSKRLKSSNQTDGNQGLKCSASNIQKLCTKNDHYTITHMIIPINKKSGIKGSRRSINFESL